MEKLTSVFFYQLEGAIKAYRQFAQSNLRRHGHNITIDQWLVLKSVSDNPDMTQSELAEAVFKDKASVTRIIDLLVKGNYLKRSEHDTSRRRFKLTLTDHGKKIMKSVIPVIRNNRELALKGLTKRDIENADKLLRRIITNCES